MTWEPRNGVGAREWGGSWEWGGAPGWGGGQAQIGSQCSGVTFQGEGTDSEQTDLCGRDYFVSDLSSMKRRQDLLLNWPFVPPTYG